MGRLIDVDKQLIGLKKMKVVDDADKQSIRFAILEFENAPTVEAIPKADYETRLKADMVAMLEELQSEIEEIVKEEEVIDKKWANGLHYSEKIIQQKINTLKGEQINETN